MGYDHQTLYVRNHAARPPHIISKPNTRAEVNKPYQYDLDGHAAAQGTRSINWDLGKFIAGELVNAPSGMSIAIDSGEITWLPGPDDVGVHAVTIVAANEAGYDTQDWEIAVEPLKSTERYRAVPVGGCARCAASSTAATGRDAAVWLLLLLALWRPTRLRG